MTDKATKQSGSSSKGSNQKKSAKSSKAAPKRPNLFQRFFAYLKNVRQEINRTSWPSRGEVLRMSAIVIGALLFFGVTIFSLDSIMTKFVAFYAKLAPLASAGASGVGGASPDSAFDLLDQLLYSISEMIN